MHACARAVAATALVTRAPVFVFADASTHAWADAKVPTELKLALQKARNAKGISQKQLATVRATAPVVEGRTRG